MSTVLENYYDPNYDPSDQEVKDYGAWLGLELPEEEELLWIAREGLKAPLPDSWKACKSEKGELYYFNFKSGNSIWDHPSDDKFKEQTATEQARRRDFIAKGKPYERPKLSSTRSRSVSPAAEKGAVSSTVVVEETVTSSSAEKKAAKKEAKLKRKDSNDSKHTAAIVASVSEETVVETAAVKVESVKSKGSKLAQLKSLKGGAKVQRSGSAVTLVENPVNNASPHAKKEKELAPLLKPSSLSVTGSAKSLPPVVMDASPQPKNPNMAAAHPAALVAPVAVVNPATTTSILKHSPTVLQVAKAEPDAVSTSIPLQKATVLGLPGGANSASPVSSPKGTLSQAQTIAAANDSVKAQKELVKNTDQAIALFKEKEEERLAAEKSKATTHYEGLLEKAREQLANKHTTTVEKIQQELEEKLTVCRQQLQQRQKDEIEKMASSIKEKAISERKLLEESNDDEIAAVRKKLATALNEEIDGMQEDHDQAVAAERAAMETRTKVEVEHIHAEMSTEDKEEWEGVGDTMNELVGNFFQSVELGLTQLTTATTSLSLQELRSQAAEKLKVVEAETSGALEKEKTSGAQAVDKYRAEFNKKFQAERDMSDERVEHLVLSNKAELHRLVEQHEATFAEMKSNHRTAKDKLEDAQQEELNFLKDAHVHRLEDLGNEMQAAFEERKDVLATHYATEEHKELSRVDLEIPRSGASARTTTTTAAGIHRLNTTAEGRHGATTDESADDVAADLLKSFPSPSPVTSTSPGSHAFHLHGGVTSGESSGERATKRDTVEKSESLRAAVFDVLQDVLQAHPMLRHLQQPTVAADQNNAHRSSTPPPPHSAAAAAAGIVTPIRGFMPPVAASAAAYGGVAYPQSFEEQQALLSQESLRVEEAKQFVNVQRSTLNEQRMKLKAARRQWKKDVLEAKSQGATAGSKQAALLRKIQRVLDQQAEGLEQDESILKDSEHWLKVKEGRVTQLTTELEVRGDCDLSALSVDTQQLMGPLLMTPGKKTAPQPIMMHQHQGSHQHRSVSADFGGKYAVVEQPQRHRSSRRRSGSPQQQPGDALHRIERRLDAMANVIVAQQATSSRSSRREPSSALIKSERSASASGPSGVLVNTTNLLHPSSATALGSGKSTANRSARKRSSSASRRVAFLAAAYPASGAASAWVSGN